MSVVLNIFSEFDSSGVKKAQKEFSQLEGVGAKANYAIKKAAIPAAAAMAGLGAALFDATKGAMEDAAAQEILTKTLKNNTAATDAQISANEDWISTQGRLLGVTDDELRPAIAKLARQTGDLEEAQRGASLAMDIAAATGKPLSAVTDALAKAYGGNTAALAKLDPKLRDLIKGGVDAEGAMSVLTDTFRGSAAAAAGTAEGQFKRLGIALAETKESIGAALLPAVEAVLPYLTKFGDWAAKHPGILLAVGGAIAVIAASIMAVNVAMALNPFSLIAIGLVAVGAALVAAYNKFEGFRNIVNAVFGAMRFWINNVTIPALNGLLAVFKTVFNGMAMLWNNSIGRLSFKFPSFVPGFGGKGFDVPNIPMLADGGIVRSATLAVIGEAGPEAVVPLNRAGEFGMGGGGSIYLTVNALDPQTAAQSVVKALQSYNRSNGAVPVNVRAL